MSATEIKPCPFCGKDPKVMKNTPSHFYAEGSDWIIECKCARGRRWVIADEGTKRKAVAAWNMRTRNTTMVDGKLPCPFCGSYPDETEVEADLCCPNCMGIWTKAGNRASAIALWNQQA